MRRLSHSGNRAVAGAVVILLAAIVIIGTLQVFNRFVLNQPLSWTEEAQRFAFIWMVFLSIPLAYDKGRHIGVDLFTARLSAALARRAALAIDALWCAFGVAVVVISLPLIRVARFQISPALEWPMHLVYAVVPLAFGWLAVVAAGRFLSTLRSRRP